MNGNDFVSLASWAGGFTTLVTMITFAWVILQTRSWHVVKHRLWLLAYGKKDIHDEEIKSCIEEQASLMAFRFRFMDVDNLNEARSLMTWAKDNDIDLGSIADCGEYFDRDRLALKESLPSDKSWELIYGLGRFVFAMLVLPLVLATLTPKAILQFKDSKTWFLSSETKARTLWHIDPPSISKDDCLPGGKIPDGTFFTKSDVENLCSAFSDEKMPGYVKDAVVSQRWSFVALFITLLVLFIALRREFNRVRASWSLFRHQKRMREKKPPSTQEMTED